MRKGPVASQELRDKIYQYCTRMSCVANVMQRDPLGCKEIHWGAKRSTGVQRDPLGCKGGANMQTNACTHACTHTKMVLTESPILRIGAG